MYPTNNNCRKRTTDPGKGRKFALCHHCVQMGQVEKSELNTSGFSSWTLTFFLMRSYFVTKASWLSGCLGTLLSNVGEPPGNPIWKVLGHPRALQGSQSIPKPCGPILDTRDPQQAARTMPKLAGRPPVPMEMHGSGHLFPVLKFHRTSVFTDLTDSQLR